MSNDTLFTTLGRVLLSYADFLTQQQMFEVKQEVSLEQLEELHFVTEQILLEFLKESKGEQQTMRQLYSAKALFQRLIRVLKEKSAEQKVARKPTQQVVSAAPRSVAYGTSNNSTVITGNGNVVQQTSTVQNTNMTQHNSGNAVGYQQVIGGGTVYIGGNVKVGDITQTAVVQNSRGNNVQQIASVNNSTVIGAVIGDTHIGDTYTFYDEKPEEQSYDTFNFSGTIRSDAFSRDFTEDRTSYQSSYSSSYEESVSDYSSSSSSSYESSSDTSSSSSSDSLGSAFGSDIGSSFVSDDTGSFWDS